MFSVPEGRAASGTGLAMTATEVHHRETTGHPETMALRGLAGKLQGAGVAETQALGAAAAVLIRGMVTLAMAEVRSLVLPSVAGCFLGLLDAFCWCK